MMWEADTMMQLYSALGGSLPPDPHRAVFGQFVCYFLVTVINVYWSMVAAII